MSAEVIQKIVTAHKAGESHADIARSLDVSRQYVGAVVRTLKLRPRSAIMKAQREKAKKALLKERARLKAERAKPHLTTLATRLAELWSKRGYTVGDMARELSTTPETVMKTASLYRRDFPELFPRRVGGRRKKA